MLIYSGYKLAKKNKAAITLCIYSKFSTENAVNNNKKTEDILQFLVENKKKEVTALVNIKRG